MENPNRLDLSSGSYLLWDTKEGVYRVALYERRVGRAKSLEVALAHAMKKPIHHKSVREVSEYIERSLSV